MKGQLPHIDDEFRKPGTYDALLVDIIENACSDSLEFASFMSKPISTLPTTNKYIESVNSEFNFQLSEMTLFKFHNSNQRKFVALNPYP